MMVQSVEVLEDKILQQAKIWTWIHMIMKKLINLLSFIIRWCQSLDKIYNPEV